jgi:hypothetical protein
LKPDVAELTRQSRLLFGLRTDDVHVFETCLPIQAQIRQILCEKTGALAKQENGNQGKYHDGNERVAAKEGSDRRFGGSTAVPSRAFVSLNGQFLRGGFHTRDDAKPPRNQQWN